ncbi:hypothetical protein CCUS01_14003 [Colletotrichum cuscutae]|uniref:Uncharacterized protein n=1 Tax=Colletotrichum cuscutae TaxID=1209917 RepID=A0AAI9YAH0_9PEZI|nr:hypothetical protein CCUS01_14003 [Colletotrichum cuscutae]
MQLGAAVIVALSLSAHASPRHGHLRNVPRASKPEISCGPNIYGLTEVRSAVNTARQHVEAVITAGKSRCPRM